MLLELTISNFAIIERATLQLEAGLNVLSGETGAGKSILIDALGAVLGTRVSSDAVRTGAQVARVEALFSLDDVVDEAQLRNELQEAGLGAEEPLLILGREIHASGRTVARVNGHPTTVAMLASIGQRLVDIHGQSEHLSLLRPAAQLDLLDRYAGTAGLRRDVGERLREWRELEHRIAEITAGARARAQRIDLLSFQVEEIERAALVPGELATLERDRQVLGNAERLRFDIATAQALLSGDEAGAVDTPSVLEQLRQASKVLASIAEIDSHAADISERSGEALVLLEDLAVELRSYAETIEGDPARLQESEDRIEIIRTLSRKYGATIEEILDHGAEAAHELEQLTGEESDVETLRASADQATSDLGRLAWNLSRKRQAAAARLSEAMEQSIAALNMGRATVRIELEQRPVDHGVPIPGANPDQRVICDESGIDQINFLLAPNLGEAPKPLSRIASGGETARLMLALKSILSDVDATPTLIFDEIDVGIGGRSAGVVGEKLAGLAERHQVVVITHLAQIAAFGDAHFLIGKDVADGRVVSRVAAVTDEERIEELAAMLGGTPITAAARANAKELSRRVGEWRARRDAASLPSERRAS